MKGEERIIMFRVYKEKVVLLVITVILMFCIGISHGSCEAKYVFNLPISVKLSEEAGIQAMLFAESVKIESAGEIEIVIFPNAEWGGSDEDYCQSLQLGTVDMVLVPVSILGLYTDALKLYDIPFLFKNPVDEAIFTFESNTKLNPFIEKKVEQANKDCNFTVLSVGSTGRRDVFTVKPVKSVEDLKGRKLRTMSSSVQVDAFELLDINASPMAYSECFFALQTKTVDGMENSPSTYMAQRFYEVAPYWIGTNHYSLVYVLAINDKAWNSLSSAHQNLIKRCAVTSAYTVAQWATGSDEICLKSDVAKVAKEMIFLTEEEQLKMRRYVLPKLLDKYFEKIGMDTIGKLAEDDEIVREWYGKNK